jgi:hypothetical protein
MSLAEELFANAVQVAGLKGGVLIQELAAGKSWLGDP